MTEVTGSVTINPLEIEHALQHAAFVYPYTRETEQRAGWTKTAVIPALYCLTVKLRKFPSSDEGLKAVLGWADSETPINDSRYINRARKLYLDFCRDMHTMGLLQRCDLFGYVQYQKSLDMRYNVDFLATLLSVHGGDQIAIQAAMRARWAKNVNNDPWEREKRNRRARRGCKDWEGHIYWLTNKTRSPAKKISGCWLFGRDHINDLATEVRDTKQVGIIAVQLSF